MEYIKATKLHIEQIVELVQDTIKTIYPKLLSIEYFL